MKKKKGKRAKRQHRASQKVALKSAVSAGKGNVDQVISLGEIDDIIYRLQAIELELEGFPMSTSDIGKILNDVFSDTPQLSAILARISKLLEHSRQRLAVKNANKRKNSELKEKLSSCEQENSVLRQEISSFLLDKAAEFEKEHVTAAAVLTQ